MRTVPIWLTAAFLLLVLCTAAVTARHEGWTDETDSWLIVRDGGVRTVLARTGYMGTPALWYLLLAPLAWSGLPFVAQQILNLLIALAALVLLVYRAPFRPLVKLAFLFSYFAAYEFSVIARSYALLMALLFGIAAVWQERKSHPARLGVLTALLANVSVHGLIIGAAIGLAFLLERMREGTARQRSYLIAILIMVGGGLAAVIQLRVPPDGQPIVRHFDPGTIPYAMGAMLLPFTDPRISFAFGLALVLFATLAAGRNYVPLLILCASFAGLLVLYQIVWYGGVRHSGILLLVVMASLWIARGYEAAEPWRDRAFGFAEAALFAGLLLSIPTTVRFWRADFTGPFSGSRETGRFIAGHIPRDVAIAAYPTNSCEPILAYLPGRQFWYATLGRYGSFLEWGRQLDEAQRRVIDAPAEEVRRRFGEGGWVLITSGRPLLDPGKQRVRLIFRSRAAFGMPVESYWIYEPITHPQ